MVKPRRYTIKKTASYVPVLSSLSECWLTWVKIYLHTNHTKRWHYYQNLNLHDPAIHIKNLISNSTCNSCTHLSSLCSSFLGSSTCLKILSEITFFLLLLRTTSTTISIMIMTITTTATMATTAPITMPLLLESSKMRIKCNNN